MSRAAFSILIYGVYALFAGLMFLFIPGFALDLYMLPQTEEHWLMVVAILTLGLAYYYFTAALSENTGFFQMSWKGRTWFGVAVIVAIILGKMPIGMMGAAFCDLLLAFWTFSALRADARAAA